MIITFDTAATLDAAEATAEARTIRGTAVPWNQTGTVSDGTRVRFLPGSLDADARPVVTLGHEGRAIGRASTNTATDAGMSTAVRVSRTRDGDEALVLAADGVLAMFSVGVNPTDWSFDDDGVMVVAAADWHHTALLPFGAFSTATVTDVAASQPIGATVTDTLTTDSPPPETEAGPPAPQTSPAVIPIAAKPPATPALTLSRVAGLIAGANRGELSTEAAKSAIQAALANVTSTNIGAVVAPAYRAELTAIVDHGTPLLSVLGGQSLPPGGMSIEYPEWTTKPTTGVQATEKTAITSTAVALTLRSAPVITIAGGNDISLQAVERSSPSFLEAYLRAAAVDWGRKAEAYVLSIMTPLATVVAPGTGSFIDRVQLLLSNLNPATTPAGPLFLAMSYDVAMPLISVTSLNGPAFWNGAINFGSMLPNVTGDGLVMFIDWNLPAKTILVGSTQSVTVYTSPGAPADIRVVDVSLLGLDVGVYGYLSCAVQYPQSTAIMTLP